MLTGKREDLEAAKGRVVSPKTVAEPTLVRGGL